MSKKAGSNMARIFAKTKRKNWGNVYNITTLRSYQVLFSINFIYLGFQVFRNPNTSFSVQYSCSESNNFWITTIIQSLLSIKVTNAWSMTSMPYAAIPPIVQCSHRNLLYVNTMDSTVQFKIDTGSSLMSYFMTIPFSKSLHVIP